MMSKLIMKNFPSYKNGFIYERGNMKGTKLGLEITIGYTQ